MNEMIDYIRQGQSWVFADGTRLPVVSGGSDTGLAGSETGTADGQTGQGGDGQATNGESDPYSLAGGFLEGVPDEHRSILEPYVKKWDAGVTRRFKELHSQYEPYKQLGDAENLAEAARVYELLNNDPQQVYEALQRHLGINGSVGQQGLPSQDDDEGAGGSEIPGLPPEFQSKFQQMEQVVELLADHILQDRQTKATQQEDQELDEYLGLLHGEFGEFDDDYVLAKMLNNGGDGEAAVKAFQKLTQQALNNTEPPKTRPVLSGGGVIPMESQNLAKVPRQDLKKFVAQMLEQTARENQ